MEYRSYAELNGNTLEHHDKLIFSDSRYIVCSHCFCLLGDDCFDVDSPKNNLIFDKLDIEDKNYYTCEDYETATKIALRLFAKFEETEETSLLPNEKMEKTIFKVLAVSKKTNDVVKNKVVTSENEQSAILKAFGVSTEKLFIKVTEMGKYTEDKPIKAVLVKEEKEKK